MKILLATSRANPTGGGIASYNQELLKLLSYNNEFCLLTDSDEKNVPGFSFEISNYGKKLDYRYLYWLVEKINSGCFDIIINSASFVLPIIVPFLKSPVISISHFVNGWLADSAGFNYKYQSRIVAISNYGKSYIEDKYKIRDCEKVKVIYNFVENKDVQDIKEKINNEPLIIVYPGGTSLNKSFDTVVKCVNHLIETSLNFSFIWLGSTSLPSSKLSLFKLRELSQIVKKDSRVKIIGKVSREDSIKYLEAANIFLLPSRGEGCPMTLLEAMRAGCIPVISDAKHGSLEVINDCGCGVITKTGDYRNLTYSLKDIIKNRTAYDNFYYKTREFIRKDLSQECWFNKMYNIIEDSIKAKKSILELSESNLRASYNKYMIIYRKNRLIVIYNSAMFRLKIELQYLLRKISVNIIKFLRG